MSAAPALGLAGRLSKLRAISAAEVMQRVRYRAFVHLERRQHAHNRLAPAGRLRHALTRPLRTGDWQRQLLAARATGIRFFESIHDRDGMRRMFESRFKAELELTRRKAADARAHRFEFFGRQFQFGDRIPWQSDPVTGQPWPSLYHADVPVHRGDIGCGDVKHVWELSRQQYVIDLAKAFFLEGDPEDLQAMQRLVQCWIAGNPYATGVNWSCALEPAFRTFSWLWAYHLTADALEDDFHLQWLCGFYDHGRFIEAHMEHHSSPYNHLIGEAAALYMLGACFPEFTDAPRWRARARSVLEGRLGEQFYGDGGSVEQSTFYHHATAGYYLMAAITARRIGEDLSPAIWSVIERALEFSMTLCQPDGRTPEIGGADDGKPIRMEHLPLWDFRPYQALGAVLFRRGDFKAVAGRFHEDALWLTGPEGAREFDALEATVPGHASSSLGQSGYYVMRSDWSEAADYVCFDCGEQATGMRPDGIPNSMHGHADCLSVVVWLAGRRLLVDSGFFAYNCGGEWEAHFRETAAHNTARIDGSDQARHIGKMAWSHSYRATPQGWMSDGRQAWALGSHDGYARGPNGITHRRAVWLRPDHYVVICDEFAGEGEHDLEVNFQFAPGVMSPAGRQGFSFDNVADLVWSGTGDWTAQLSCGGATPHEGWIAPSLGVRQAAPRLSLRCRSTAARTTLLTVLAARLTDSPRVSVVSAGAIGAEGSLVAVTGDGYRDWIAAAGLAGGQAIASDALVAVCRVRGADVVETARVGGTGMKVDGVRLERLAASGVRTSGVAQ